MSLWCFIACFSLAGCLVSGQNEKYALVGKKVDFPGFSNFKESLTDILWKQIQGHNVHKVVHFDSSEQKSFGSFEDRVTLDWRSADLSISNLRHEDSGFYDLEILINNKLMNKRYDLKVIDKVTKPTISCDINNASSSELPGKATMLCSLPSHSDQSSLEFQWSTNGKIDPGHVLKISLGGENDDRQYTCTVKNPLTQESAVFTAKDCYPKPKSQAGLIAGGVTLVVLLLLILLLFIFFYLKKVCSNREKSDLESHSEVPASESETQVLLDRAPTFPSKQVLEHQKERNDTVLDPPQNNDAHMNELKESIRRRSFQERRMENGKPSEAEPRDIVENNPSDSEAMNPESLLSESSLCEKPEDVGFSSNSAVPPDLDLSCSDDKRPGDEDNSPDILDKEDNPANADETKDTLPGLENNENEDNKASHPPSVPQKSTLVRNFSALIKATESTNPKVIKKQRIHDPSDSGNPIEVSNDQRHNATLHLTLHYAGLSEQPENSGFSSPPAVPPDLDLSRSDDKRPGDEDNSPDILDKEDNPANADETKDTLPGSENNENEDNKASHPPSVPQKSALVRNFSPLKKATESTNPEDKRPVPNGSSDSGIPDQVPENQNSESKKEENEFAKSTPENDVQPPPVASESSPLSQNAPQISPEAEHKQDINADEYTMTNSGESSSASSEESENEEQAPAASTAKETDSETTVEEQRSALFETESEMETLQNK